MQRSSAIVRPCMASVVGRGGNRIGEASAFLSFKKRPDEHVVQPVGVGFSRPAAFLAQNPVYVAVAQTPEDVLRHARIHAPFEAVDGIVVQNVPDMLVGPFLVDLFAGLVDESEFRIEHSRSSEQS